MHNHEVEWIVTLGAAGALLVGVAGSMLRAQKRAAEWQGGVEARWREAAEALGGTLEVGASPSLTPRRLALRVASEDVVATVAASVPVDPGAPSHTRASARFALGVGPAFRMRERGPGDRPGREDEVLPGHPLARRVRIATDAPSAVAALFSPTARAHAAAFARALSLRSDGSAVEIVWDGTELDRDVLAHALGMVRELASFGTSTLRELAELEGADYVGGEVPYVRVSRHGVEVELHASIAIDGVACEALAAMRRGSLPEFSVRIDGEGGLHGTLPPGVIDPELSPCLRELGECTLSLEGDELELMWASVPDLARAEAAVRVLASIAGGTGRQGAFR